MAQLLNKAQPGDVITAEDWNLVVDAINELLQSGQTSGIKMAALLPAGTAIDPIRIGLLMQITGQNFGFAIGQSKVTFEQFGNQVVVLRQNMLAGSSDERLLFIMPPVPGITPDGVTSTMRVDNGVASDTRSVIVKPVVIDLAGDMFVTFRGDAPPNPNPNPILASQAASFLYRFQAATNLPASFDLVAEIPTASVAIPAGLVETIEFRDQGNAVIPGKRIELGKNETRNITVRIPQIPATFNNQRFTLRVRATAGAVTGNDQREFPVGIPVVESDPAIEIQQTTHTVFDIVSGQVDSNPANGRLDGGSSILLKAGKVMHVPFNVSLKQAAIYNVTIQAKPGTTLTGWTLQLINTPGTINAPSNDPPRVFTFGINPNAGAVATGSIIFKVKRTGVATEWSKEFSVQLLT
jgi:hypothetical protein